jgi:hypothetical protein
MRRLFVCLLAASMCSAHAETIENVLERSQQVRLAKRPAPNPYSRAAERVRASLTRLLALPDAAGAAVELTLVGGRLHAEALLDRNGIVASEALGDLPENERLLMLAHELGHLRLAHAHALKAMYQRHVPADVVREATDPVAAVLDADGRALSHAHELAADAWGYRLARRLGVTLGDAMNLLGRQGAQLDTPTHPGTASRFTRLRDLEERLARE